MERRPDTAQLAMIRRAPPPPPLVLSSARTPIPNPNPITHESLSPSQSQSSEIDIESLPNEPPFTPVSTTSSNPPPLPYDQREMEPRFINLLNAARRQREVSPVPSPTDGDGDASDEDWSTADGRGSRKKLKTTAFVGMDGVEWRSTSQVERGRDEDRSPPFSEDTERNQKGPFDDEEDAWQDSPKDGNKKLRCPWPGCKQGRNNGFSTPGHLARRIHTGERDYVCFFPGCESAFTRRDNLIQHQKTHTGERSNRRRRRPNGTGRPTALNDVFGSQQQHPSSVIPPPSLALTSFNLGQNQTSNLGLPFDISVGGGGTFANEQYQAMRRKVIEQRVRSEMEQRMKMEEMALANAFQDGLRRREAGGTASLPPSLQYLANSNGFLNGDGAVSTFSLPTLQQQSTSYPREYQPSPSPSSSSTNSTPLRPRSNSTSSDISTNSNSRASRSFAPYARSEYEPASASKRRSNYTSLADQFSDGLPSPSSSTSRARSRSGSTASQSSFDSNSPRSPAYSTSIGSNPSSPTSMYSSPSMGFGNSGSGSGGSSYLSSLFPSPPNQGFPNLTAPLLAPPMAASSGLKEPSSFNLDGSEERERGGDSPLDSPTSRLGNLSLGYGKGNGSDPQSPTSPDQPVKIVPNHHQPFQQQNQKIYFPPSSFITPSKSSPPQSGMGIGQEPISPTSMSSSTSTNLGLLFSDEVHHSPSSPTPSISTSTSLGRSQSHPGDIRVDSPLPPSTSFYPSFTQFSLPTPTSIPKLHPFDIAFPPPPSFIPTTFNFGVPSSAPSEAGGRVQSTLARPSMFEKNQGLPTTASFTFGPQARAGQVQPFVFGSVDGNGGGAGVAGGRAD